MWYLILILILIGNPLESDPDEVLGMPRFFIQSGAGLLSLDTGNLTINFLPFIVYTILAFLLGK